MAATLQIGLIQKSRLIIEAYIRANKAKIDHYQSGLKFTRNYQTSAGTNMASTLQIDLTLNDRGLPKIQYDDDIPLSVVLVIHA